MNELKLKKGRGIALGIAIFTPIGVALWLTTKNPGLIGVGLTIGVAVGIALDRNENPDLSANKKICGF